MNRKELRNGVPLRIDCFKAHTINDSGDVVCLGLHYEENAFAVHDVPKECKMCGAWQFNYLKHKIA